MLLSTIAKVLGECFWMNNLISVSLLESKLLSPRNPSYSSIVLFCSPFVFGCRTYCGTGRLFWHSETGWQMLWLGSSRCRRQSSWGWPQLSLSFSNNFSNYVNWRIDHELDYEQGGKIGTEGLKWLDLLVDFSCFLILNWLFLPVKLCKQIWILHDCKDTPILEYLVLIFFSIYHTFHCQPHQIPHRHPLRISSQPPTPFSYFFLPQNLSPTFFFFDFLTTPDLHISMRTNFNVIFGKVFWKTFGEQKLNYLRFFGFPLGFFLKRCHRTCFCLFLMDLGQLSSERT